MPSIERVIIALAALSFAACAAPADDLEDEALREGPAVYLVDWPESAYAYLPDEIAASAEAPEDASYAELVDPPACSLDALIERLAGEDARDCGWVAPGAPSAATAECVKDAFAAGDSFYAVYELQGYEGTVQQIVAGNRMGYVFLTDRDEAPCGEPGACAPTSYTTRCVAPAFGPDGAVQCSGAEPMVHLLCE